MIKSYIFFVQILDILFDLCVCFLSYQSHFDFKRVWICLEFARTNNANEVLRLGTMA